MSDAIASGPQRVRNTCRVQPRVQPHLGRHEDLAGAEVDRLDRAQLLDPGLAPASRLRIAST